MPFPAHMSGKLLLILRISGQVSLHGTFHAHPTSSLMLSCTLSCPSPWGILCVRLSTLSIIISKLLKCREGSKGCEPSWGGISKSGQILPGLNHLGNLIEMDQSLWPTPTGILYSHHSTLRWFLCIWENYCTRVDFRINNKLIILCARSTFIK